MGLSSGFESNALGGLGAGFGAGGFGGAGFGFGGGGIAPIGLFGLMGLGDRHDHKKDDDCSKALFMMNAIGNLKDTIYEAKDTLGNRVESLKDNLDSRLDSVKDSLTSRVEDAKDKVVDEGRAIGKAIAEAEKTNLQQFYAQAIQTANATQAIKDQATAFAIVADKRFDDLAAAGVNQTAAILAKINQVEIDQLRDQLHGERRRVDSKDIEINMTNIQNQNQQQLQAQAQVQLQRDYEHARRFDALFAQTAKAGQDIVNIGGLMAGVAQTANPTNVKA